MSFYPSLPVNANWSTTAGSLDYTNNAITLFTAPDFATNATVTATVGNSKPMSITFNVVAPTGVDHAVIVATNNISGAPNFTSGQAGAEMLLNVYFAPTNVSFYNVSVMEVAENATSISGYFSQFTLSQLFHGTAGHWTVLNQANGYQDICWLGPLPQPYYSGGYTWEIPADWQVTGTGQTNPMTGWNQVFSMDSSADVTIQKLNCSVTRTTNNVITTN
jgi:hypothetical protein